MTLGRRKPYTQIGVRRIPCVRCGAPSVHQWQICSLDSRWVTCCLKCDIQLNETVLKFMRIPYGDKLARDYRRRQEAAQ